MSISIFDPRTMMEAVENRPVARSFLRDMFFKRENIRTFSTKHVDVDYFKGRRRMAPFVSPRLAGKTLSREGMTTQTYQPPQIKPDRVTTVDHLETRLPGDNPYESKSPADRAKVILAKDLIDLDDSISRREEWMFAQILFTGKVHMLGEGVDQILDFNFTQKEILSGTSLWTDSLSDPFEYLFDRRRKVIQNSGVNPDILLLASDVVMPFIQHPKIMKLLDTKAIDVGRINPRILPNGTTFIGSITSLGLDVYCYDEWYLDEDTDPDNPVEKAMVPPGHILLASSRAKFNTYYGAVTLVNPDTKQFFTVEGDRIPHSWVTVEPPTHTLQLNARPLPVPHEVDSWLVAKVI